jgi:hypothetical protein
MLRIGETATAGFEDAGHRNGLPNEKAARRRPFDLC